MSSPIPSSNCFTDSFSSSSHSTASTSSLSSTTYSSSSSSSLSFSSPKPLQLPPSMSSITLSTTTSQLRTLPPVEHVGSSANSFFEEIRESAPTPEKFDELLSTHRDSDADYQLEYTGGGCEKEGTVLKIAMEIGSLPLTQHILNLDPTLVNKPVANCLGGYNPWPALHYAAGHKNPQFALAAVKLLISKGADVTVTRLTTDTALTVAAKKENFAAMKYLILCGSVGYDVEKGGLVEKNIHQGLEELWSAKYLGKEMFSSKKPSKFLFSNLPTDLLIKISYFL